MAEIKRLKLFLNDIDKRLNNEKFLLHANSLIIEKEKKKKEDTLKKLAHLEGMLGETFLKEQQKEFGITPFQTKLYLLCDIYNYTNCCYLIWLCEVLRLKYNEEYIIKNFLNLNDDVLKRPVDKGVSSKKGLNILNQFNITYEKIQGIDVDYALLDNEPLTFVSNTHIDMNLKNCLDFHTCYKIELVKSQTSV